MEPIEREWITSAAGGDMRAFEAIYQRTAGFVYSLAFRVTNRKQDAEEVTQDVFLKVHKNLANFKFESSFKTWLYRVAINTALNAVQKRDRIANREVEEVPEDAATATPADASRRLEAEEAEKRLRGLLERLNPDQRACLLLREVDGMNYQEIAESLGINLNTVRSRLKRAREALMALGQKEVAGYGV
ncbi:MAG: RNA polymerase sigma factor [Candidatus Omnitrophica bacterium]|nr:RNA polymerase sigma factor [Candidatus Omnitrophota bacterium]